MIKYTLYCQYDCHEPTILSGNLSRLSIVWCSLVCSYSKVVTVEFERHWYWTPPLSCCLASWPTGWWCSPGSWTPCWRGAKDLPWQTRAPAHLDWRVGVADPALWCWAWVSQEVAGDQSWLWTLHRIIFHPHPCQQIWTFPQYLHQRHILADSS